MTKILVIEDDPIWQIKLKLILEELGYLHFVVSSLAEAKIKILENKPDVILSDVILSDGQSIAYFSSNLPECPIIFITEVADRNFVDAISDIPHSSFFVKPFHGLTLLSAIRSAINTFKITNAKNKVMPVSVRYGTRSDIPIDSIVWIIVEGNYSTIKTINQQFVQKLSFSKITPFLDENFIRVHKSAIINLKYLENYSLTKNTVVVQSKTFQIGRSFRRKFIATIYKQFPTNT